MDYKYIKQLLERYWKCETSLEEEEILRTFFSQKEMPSELLRYKHLFTYEQNEVKDDVLGEDFDEKILSIIEEPVPVKAKVINMTHRLMPLFKAAAIVAIVLTLGNAAQVSFNSNKAGEIGNVSGYNYNKVQHGTSVAMGDSSIIDTLKQSSIQSEEGQTILK